MVEKILLNSVKEPLLLPTDDGTPKNRENHYAGEEHSVELGRTMKSESHYISCHGITQLVGQRSQTCRRLPSKVILENIRLVHVCMYP